MFTLHKINQIGAITSVFILSVCCLIFIFRLLGNTKTEFLLGLGLMISMVPLLMLLLTVNRFERPPIYVIQLGLMIGFLLIELLLDYVLKFDFRTIGWATVLYLVVFYGGTGGMIGIASHAGRIWMIMAVFLFLIMTVLSLVQRSITGM